jgi:glycosyltransferase involved in cell wall biosynthesis
MRIAIVASSRLPTEGGGYGFQERLLNAVQYLDRRHTYILIDLNNSKVLEFTGSQFVSRVSIQEYLPAKRFWSSRGDNVHLVDHIAQKESVDLAWFLTPASTAPRVSFITTLWDLEFKKQPWFPEFSQEEIKIRDAQFSDTLPKAYKVVVGTSIGKSEVEFFYRVNPSNIEVIPFVVLEPLRPAQTKRIDQEYLSNNYNIGSKYFFYPAQFWPHKNHFNLLKAFKYFLDATSGDFQIVFSGSDKGNLSHIKNTTEMMGLEQFVTFTGFVPKEDLEILYRNAEGLIYPSYFGPDNLPPIEAISYGCPVAVADIPGAREQYEDAALYFHPGNYIGIADAMRSLSDPLIVERLNSSGKELLRKKTITSYMGSINRIFSEFESIRNCWI